MVDIIYTYKPSKLDTKLINILDQKIMNSDKYKKHYNNTYSQQKYTLKTILQKIFYVLYKGRTWDSLGSGYSNVHTHFKRLKKLFTASYTELLQKYLKLNKRSLKIVSVDTTIILNKNGKECIARNKYAKNKNCNKLFLIVDQKRKPVFYSLHSGNKNDSKIFSDDINNFFNIVNDKTKILLADAGFDSNINRTLVTNKKVYPLIPKNIRNKGKKKKMKELKYKKRIEIMFRYFKKNDRKLYKKRMCIEHFFANFKQIHRFDRRQDKNISSLDAFIALYLLKMLV